MRQHCANAEYVVNFLKKHKEVTKAYSTEHDKSIAERAKKYLTGGNGPMVGIELKGGIGLVKLLSLKNVLSRSKYLRCQKFSYSPS